MSESAVRHLTHGEVFTAAERAASVLSGWLEQSGKDVCLVHPIPRGGVPAYYAVHQVLRSDRFIVTDHPDQADVFFDDVLDSGRTRDRYRSQYPGIPFFTLVRRQEGDPWVVFPWEHHDAAPIEDSVIRILEYIGENPNREGLQETPLRYMRALEFWTSGYRMHPSEVLKTFSDGADSYDGIVFQGGMPLYSLCEHHLTPFFGVAYVGYIPNGRVIGLSKLNRLVELFSRRLQVQERLTSSIAHALYDHLRPLAVGVVVECRHLCIESRGVERPGTKTVTSSMLGEFRSDPAARQEFLKLVDMSRKSM